MTKATVVSVLLLIAVANCKKSERRAGESSASNSNAAATGSGGSARTSTPVKVALTVQGHDVKLVIPETQPAVIGFETWSKKLALVADERSATKITLRVGLVPASVEAEAIDMATFASQAVFTQSLEKGQSVTLTPGSTIPRDGLGDAPQDIKITWLQ